MPAPIITTPLLFNSPYNQYTDFNTDAYSCPSVSFHLPCSDFQENQESTSDDQYNIYLIKYGKALKNALNILEKKEELKIYEEDTFEAMYVILNRQVNDIINLLKLCNSENAPSHDLSDDHQLKESKSKLENIEYINFSRGIIIQNIEETKKICIKKIPEKPMPGVVLKIVESLLSFMVGTMVPAAKLEQSIPAFFFVLVIFLALALFILKVLPIFYNGFVFKSSEQKNRINSYFSSIECNFSRLSLENKKLRLLFKKEVKSIEKEIKNREREAQRKENKKIRKILDDKIVELKDANILLDKKQELSENIDALLWDKRILAESVAILTSQKEALSKEKKKLLKEIDDLNSTKGKALEFINDRSQELAAVLKELEKTQALLQKAQTQMKWLDSPDMENVGSESGYNSFSGKSMSTSSSSSSISASSPDLDRHRATSSHRLGKNTYDQQGLGINISASRLPLNYS